MQLVPSETQRIMPEYQGGTKLEPLRQLLCARARGPPLELSFFRDSSTSTDGNRNFAFQLQGYKRQAVTGNCFTGCGVSEKGHTNQKIPAPVPYFYF